MYVLTMSIGCLSHIKVKSFIIAKQVTNVDMTINLLNKHDKKTLIITLILKNDSI